MKKKLFSLILSAIMVVGMTACGSGGGEVASDTPSASSSQPQSEAPSDTGKSEQAPAGDITLRFSWWGGDSRHEATLKAIETYEAAHPGIKIEPEYSSFSGYYEKLVTQLASQNAPDVFQVDQGWVAELSARGDAFTDLSQFSDVLDLTQVSEKMMDDYCKVDGQVSVLPFGYNGTVFLYNKTLLADWCDADGKLQMSS